MKRLMAKIQIIIALLLVNACDFGCVSSEEFGTVTLKAVELHSSPFGSFRLREHISAKCKPGCETGDEDDPCSSYNYWTNITEPYSSFYQYEAKVKGNVSFCSAEDAEFDEYGNIVRPSIPGATLFASLSASRVDLQNSTEDNFVEYAYGAPVPRWNDELIDDRSATQGGLASMPSPNCAGQNVILSEVRNSDGALIRRTNATLGDYSDINQINSNLNNVIEHVEVPLGCRVRLYLQRNFLGGYTELGAGSHYTESSSPFTNSCTENVIVYYGSNYSGSRSLSKGNYCWIVDAGISNDAIDGYYIPQGCFVEEYRHSDGCGGSHMGTLKPGMNLADEGYLNDDLSIIESYDRNQVSGIKIIDSGSSYGWKDNISSVKILNGAASSGFSDTNNMEPVVHYETGDYDGVFGSNPGLFFDGDNDYYDYDHLKTILINDHTIFLVVKDPSGTIFSAVDGSINIRDRLFVDVDGLKYQNSSGTYVLNDNALPTETLITLIRDGSNLKVRINGQEVFDDSVGSLSSGLDKANIGMYWGAGYYPSDFYSGYLGNITMYIGTISGQYLEDAEKQMMLTWGIINCALNKHLDRIRLRVGDYEEDVEIFDAFGNLAIPDSYAAHNNGNMLIRYSDPETDGGGCIPTADIYDIYADNLGNVDINFKITKDASFIGKIYDFFIVPIENYIRGDETNQGLQEAFFEDVVFSNDSLFQKLVTTALTFYVIMTAIGYLMGLVKFSHWEFIGRIIKSGIIISLISDGSWEFFSTFVVDFFREGALNLAGNISSVVSSETGIISNRYDASIVNVFHDLDTVLAMFISGDINAKILALTFHPPFTGFLMVLMFYYAFYNYVEIIAKILILYVSIFLMMTFTFIVAPVFLIFMLFKQTQSYFNKWLDLLVGYFLQYIFLAAVIGIFSWIIVGMFVSLMGYSVCWKPVLECCSGLPFTFTVLEFFRPATFDYRRFNLAVKANYVPGFWDVALFLFIVYFFRQFLMFSIDLAAKIAGGVSTSGIADAVSDTLGTNNIYKSTKSRLHSALDNAGGAMSGASKVVGALTGDALGFAAGKMFGKDAGNKVRNAMKSGISNPYRSARAALHRNTIGAMNRALGQMDPGEKALVDSIKGAVKEGRLNAARDGVDKETAIKDAVRKTLEKKGMSKKDIDKVLNSKQLNRDVKQSRLKTSEAKELLTNEFDKKYKEARGKNMSDAEAREHARAHIDTVKANIGKTLREEDAVARNRSSSAGGKNTAIDNLKKTWNSGKAGKAAAIAAAPVMGVAGAASALGNGGSKAMARLRNAASYATGNSASRRHKNIARMSRFLDKEFASRDPNAPKKGFISRNASALKDGAVGAGRRVERFGVAVKEQFSSASEEAKAEREKYNYEFGGGGKVEMKDRSLSSSAKPTAQASAESGQIKASAKREEEDGALDSEGDEVLQIEDIEVEGAGATSSSVAQLTDGAPEAEGKPEMLAIKDVEGGEEEEDEYEDDFEDEEEDDASVAGDDDEYEDDFEEEEAAEVNDETEYEDKMATRIQSAFRGMKARQETSSMRADQESAKRVAEENARKAAAQKIAGAYKNTLDRRKEQNQAATTIQAGERGRQGRARAEQMRRDRAAEAERKHIERIRGANKNKDGNK